MLLSNFAHQFCGYLLVVKLQHVDCDGLRQQQHLADSDFKQKHLTCLLYKKPQVIHRYLEDLAYYGPFYNRLGHLSVRVSFIVTQGQQEIPFSNIFMSYLRFV